MKGTIVEVHAFFINIFRVLNTFIQCANIFASNLALVLLTTGLFLMSEILPLSLH